jgi:hypothetical protein
MALHLGEYVYSRGSKVTQRMHSQSNVGNVGYCFVDKVVSVPSGRITTYVGTVLTLLPSISLR